MRTWIVISLLVFVLFTIVLTILFSEPTVLENPVTGMNVKVQEGNVRVSSASQTDMVRAGEIARIGTDGRIRKEKSESPVVETTADADIQAASSSQPAAFSAPEIVMLPTDTQPTDSSIEYVTKEVFYIAGYVQNEDGNYLTNSQITCRRQSSDRLESVKITHSDPKGYYIFQLPEPGDYEVRSSPVEEEYFEETKAAQLTETKKDTALFFVHRRGALTFKGRVIAQKGSEPIAGAKVILIGNDQSPMAVSGEDGRFRIKNISEDSFNVFASVGGYIDYDARERKMQGIAEPFAEIHVSSDTQSNEYTIKMEEAGAVTVLVVDANQTPVSSVWVSAHPYGNKQDSAISTNENGVAEFTNIPPGKVLFRTEKKGYGETSSDIVETGTLDAPTKVTVVLSAPSSISGRITFQDGSPAEGWDIFVHNLSTARRIELTSIISTRVKTDPGGNYTISGLGKGEYTFFIIKYGDFGKQRVSTDRVITLQDGEDKQGVDFVIEEGTETVAGIVLSQDGNPIPGAKVMVHPVGGSGPNTIFSEAVSITDEKGEFSVGKLHKKSHIMVEAEAEGYKPFRSGFPMEEYVTVTLTAAEIISGIVRDQSTQQPIAGASVILRGRFVRDRVEITSVNGTFSFANFEAGTYQLFAFADGYAYSQILQIETESNIQANPIVLPLEKAIEFRGIVADSSGKPVLGAIIGLQSRMRNPNVPEEYRGIIFTETSLSNDNGAFLIANRAHQADTLIIGQPQFAMAAYPLPAEWDNNQPPVFYLNQGGTVEGVVLNEEHNPITQGEIHFVDASNFLFGGKVKIASNGSYRIDRLPASNYRVHLYADIEKDMGFVQVLENQTSRIDFVAGK